MTLDTLSLRKFTSDFGTENPGGAIIIQNPYSSSTILDVAANDTIRRSAAPTWHFQALKASNMVGRLHRPYWHVGVGLDPPLTALCCLDTRYHRPTLWGVCNGAFQECCVEFFCTGEASEQLYR